MNPRLCSNEAYVFLELVSSRLLNSCHCTALAKATRANTARERLVASLHMPAAASHPTLPLCLLPLPDLFPLSLFKIIIKEKSHTHTKKRR